MPEQVLVLVVLLVSSSEILCAYGKSQVEMGAFYESDEGFKCQLCPVGKYLERSCEKNFGPSICKTCPVGTFSDRPSQAKSCKECSHCPVSQVETKMCRKNTDTRCACPLGTYYEAQNGGLCLKDTSYLHYSWSGMYKAVNGLWCKLCPAGSYVLSQCERNYGSSRCSDCSEGTFSSRPSYATRCEDCSICPIGQLKILDCTTVTNTQCKCPDGQFWKIEGEEQGVCTPHTVCKPGESVLKAGTTITDTICEIKRKKVKNETNKNIGVVRINDDSNRRKLFISHGSISRQPEAREKTLPYNEVKDDDFGSHIIKYQNFNPSKIEPKATSVPNEDYVTGVTELSTNVYTTSYSVLANDLRTSLPEDSDKQTLRSKLAYVSDNSKMVSNENVKITKMKVGVVNSSTTTKPTVMTLESGKRQHGNRKRRRMKKGKGLSRRNRRDRKRRKKMRNPRKKKNGKTKRKKRCRGRAKRKKRCRRKKKKRPSKSQKNDAINTELD